MEQRQWGARVFEVPGAIEEIAKTIDALGVKVIDAFEWLDEGGDPRVLIAADIGLLDCHHVAPDTTNLRVRVVPWEAVPAPWIAYVWRGTNPEDATVTFEVAIEPPVRVVSAKHAQKQAISEFYRVLLSHR